MYDWCKVIEYLFSHHNLNDVEYYYYLSIRIYVDQMFYFVVENFILYKNKFPLT